MSHIPRGMRISTVGDLLPSPNFRICDTTHLTASLSSGSLYNTSRIFLNSFSKMSKEDLIKNIDEIYTLVALLIRIIQSERNNFCKLRSFLGICKYHMKSMFRFVFLFLITISQRSYINNSDLRRTKIFS